MAKASFALLRVVQANHVLVGQTTHSLADGALFRRGIRGSCVHGVVCIGLGSSTITSNLIHSSISAHIPFVTELFSEYAGLRAWNAGKTLVKNDRTAPYGIAGRQRREQVHGNRAVLMSHRAECER